VSRGVESLSVSVVVPTYRYPSGLEEVVTAALADSVVSEAVVVVDGCRDGSLELLERMAQVDRRVKPMFIEHSGENMARQRGAEAATGEILLFLDHDVVAGTRLAWGHARRHEGRDRLVVMGYMPMSVGDGYRPDDVPSRIYGKDYEAQCRAYEQDPANVLLYFWAGNFSIRRRDALEVGLFSPTYPGVRLGDWDFGLRCARSGMTGRFDRSLLAHHRRPRSLDDFLEDEAQYIEELEVIHQLHGDLIGPFSFSEHVAGLPRPMLMALRTARADVVAAAELAVLKRIVALGGRLKWARAQNAAGLLARALEQQRRLSTSA
jgi:glycosyltransferase involved in cell wall biosynthesis